MHWRALKADRAGGGLHRDRAAVCDKLRASAHGRNVKLERHTLGYQDARFSRPCAEIKVKD